MSKFLLGAVVLTAISFGAENVPEPESIPENPVRPIGSLRTIPTPLAEQPRFNLAGLVYWSEEDGSENLRFDVRVFSSSQLGDDDQSLSLLSKDPSDTLQSFPGIQEILKGNADFPKNSILEQVVVDRKNVTNGLIDLESIDLGVPYESLGSLPDGASKLWLHLSCVGSDNTERFASLAAPLSVLHDLSRKEIPVEKPPVEIVKRNVLVWNEDRKSPESKSVEMPKQSQDIPEALGIKVLIPKGTLSPGGSSQFADYRVHFYFATNRNVVRTERGRPRFGIEQDANLNYGFASVGIKLPLSGERELVANPEELVTSILDRENFMRSVAGESSPEDVLVFVHGYDTDFTDACLGFGELVFELRSAGFAARPILFSWPSLGRRGAHSFARDLEVATESANDFNVFLQNLLTQINSVDRIRRIHLVGHSMGTRVLTVALGNFSDSQNPRFENLIFLAGEVGHQTLMLHSAKLATEARFRTFYFSENDTALRLAHELSPILDLRNADPMIESPVGVNIWPLHGVENIGCSQRASSTFGFQKGFNHSYYTGDSFITKDLIQVLKGIRPAGRIPPLKKRNQGMRVDYWAFPAR